jgi:hypothetical protein
LPGRPLSFLPDLDNNGIHKQIANSNKVGYEALSLAQGLTSNSRSQLKVKLAVYGKGGIGNPQLAVISL